MSSVIASSTPATRAAPTDPGGRARDERDRRMRGRLGERGEPARGAHHERLRQSRAGRRAAERLQVPRDHRPEIGVDRGRRGPLVLAQLGRELVRGDDARARQAPPQLLRDGPLVRGVAEREKQADRDRLDAVEVRQRVELERLEHAVGADPLADAVTALERDERLGVRRAEPVELRAVLPPQVEQVLEAGGRDERRPRALALEQGVRRDRRAVREALDLGRTDGRRRGEHRLLLPRRRRHLCRPQLAVGEQHGVGEGPADVDTQDGHGETLSSRRGPQRWFVATAHAGLAFWLFFTRGSGGGGTS